MSEFGPDGGARRGARRAADGPSAGVEGVDPNAFAPAGEVGRDSRLWWAWDRCVAGLVWVPLAIGLVLAAIGAVGGGGTTVAFWAFLAFGASVVVAACGGVVRILYDSPRAGLLAESALAAAVGVLFAAYGGAACFVVVDLLGLHRVRWPMLFVSPSLAAGGVAGAAAAALTFARRLDRPGGALDGWTV